MDRGKGNEGEKEKGEANNSLVSSTTIRDDIINMLDFIEICKDEVPNDLDMDNLEKLTGNLIILSRFIQFSHPNLDDFKSTVPHKSYDIQSEGDFEDAFLRLLDYIKSSFCLQHHSKSSATMTEVQLAELLGSILLTLQDLSSVESVFPIMIQYEALQNACSNIRDFHELKVKGCIEPETVKYVIPQLQVIAERVGHFCWVLSAYEFNRFLGDDEKLDFPRYDVTLFHLLDEIMHVEVEIMHIFTNLKASISPEVGYIIKQLQEYSPYIMREYLIHLQNHMVNVNSTCDLVKKIHIVIEFLLVVLTDMPKDFINHDKLFDLLAHVGKVTKEVSVLVHNLEDTSRNDRSINETNCAILYVLENIELLKRDLRNVYLKASDLSKNCFHMGDGPLFMNLLLGNLNDMFNSNAYPVALIRQEIELVKEDLQFIRSFFDNTEEELNEDLWKCVLDVAYEANDVINSILARDNGLLHLIFSLPSVIEKIELIKEEVSNVPVKIPKNMGLIAVKPPKKLVKNMSSTVDQICVGFEEETNWIVRKLTNGPPELDVISIIGMPGLGKTTLAYKVYNDRSVIGHFDIRAWCTVDQVYNRKIVLHKIFNQVTGSEKEFTEDVDDVLRKKLYGRRYLIVLDDLWDAAAWDDLTASFPQVEKVRSRIILTSRMKDVALWGKRHSDPLNLRLLSPEESWELLEKRVFREESCPVDLLDVGKEIAQNCRGLPLMVVLIAGVIARMEKEKIVWLDCLKNLNSFISNDEVEVMKVIQLSYDRLSNNLKLCFLYLGSHPKDKQFLVNELNALWSAEGFVEQTEMKSVEEVIEDYLDELVCSSLVMVSTEKYGTNKLFQIHDLVHDFCLVKARKEKLFDVISSSASSCSSSSSDLLPRQLTIHYDKHLLQSYKNIVLLDSENKRDSSGKHLLSLKITGEGEDHHICHLRHLRLLRVLNLDSDFITVPDYLMNEIGMLVHLRYLNIETQNLDALPLSFSNLCNLETLMLDNLGDPVVVEPVIWNLAKLRHVEINLCLFCDLDTCEPTPLAEYSVLKNLRILERLCLSCSKGPVDISTRFPNLRELRCQISWDSSAGCNWIPQFGLLNELEVLSVESKIILNPNKIPVLETRYSSDNSLFFPSGLKSLMLECCHVTSNSLSTIARLPNLQLLLLRGLHIQGGEWKMRDVDTFQNLKFLQLEFLTFSEWQVGEESFPVLEHLILRCCLELKEIPPSFGDTDSLKSIELIYSLQLEDSALKIKQYVKDLTGEDKLQVLVRNYEA